MNNELIVILRAIRNTEKLCHETKDLFSCDGVECDSCPLMKKVFNSEKFYITKFLELGERIL